MAWILQFPRNFQHYLTNAPQSSKPAKLLEEEIPCNDICENLHQDDVNGKLYLQVALFTGHLTLGIGIGSGFYFIRRGSVPREAFITMNDCAEFEADNGRIVSLGSVMLEIFGRPTKFRVISDDHMRANPEFKDGLLGEAFFSHARVLFKAKTMIFKEVIVNNRQAFANKTEAKVAEADKSARRVISIVEAIDFTGNNLEQREWIVQLISSYRQHFYLPGDKLKATNVIKYKVNLNDDTPIASKPYRRYCLKEKEEMMKQVDTMLRQGVIVPSKSKWNSPCDLQSKKDSGGGPNKWRFILACSALNDRMEKDDYRMTTDKEILRKLDGAQYYTIVDLACSSHQIELHPEDRAKTAFTTSFGKFEFKRFPIGMQNGSKTVQRMMDKVLEGLASTTSYQDDVIVYSKTPEEHKQHVNALFERFEAANLSLQTSKCQFFKKTVKYLGVTVSGHGFQPDPDKVAKILNFPKPCSLAQIRDFLAKVRLLRQYIQNLFDIAEPLVSVVYSKDQKFIWGHEQQSSFESLRDAARFTPTLIHPDYEKVFYLTTGASDVAIRATLSQGGRDRNRPVAYFSKSLTEKKRKYSKLEKEVYAVVQGILRFKVYFGEKKFVFIGNRKALDRLRGNSDDSGAEDVEEIKSFGFKVDQVDDTTFSLKRC